jgi:hypothetical protein
MPRYYDIIKKICKKCNLEKDICEFYIKKISKDGYRNTCKTCDCKASENQYNNNKEYFSNKAKKWRETNEEKTKENINKFYLNNPDYRKNYQKNNKVSINERYKNRIKTDINFKVKENIRHLISNSIKNNGFSKNTKTEEILGLSVFEFKIFIENQFESWMNWENYGNPKDGILEPNKTWDLDHIIPISTAKTQEDIIRLSHYTNLRPFCSYNNRIIKRGKYGSLLR